ncbi:uncharacterized protein LOC108145113 [Drosophila elegans]|uniref:uncharacterized protein LOC108145113 n=1 Tax=Drosophila elegans TaxID=30023 RepID=UPI001BC853E9|nr:uncharacterized protein LOC108145113 [Drosophila elegans]
MKDEEFAQGLEQFAYCLHEQLCRANPGQNIIYSPLSVRTSAGMLRMAATEGSATAKELDEGLRFAGRTVPEIAESFDAVLKAFEKCPILKMANGFYVMKGHQLSEQFGSILEKKFHSKSMEIDFGSDQAASIINNWVESQTNNLIKDIIGPGVLSKNSRLVLINAIHFKGMWSIGFNESETQEELFFSEPGKPVKVRMMHVSDKFSFASLPNLEATALKMNYSACNLAMIVILPDEKSSLEILESKLPSTSLEALLSSMNLEQVDVKIPSFKTEFQQELSQAFKLMDMSRIFSSQADLGALLKTQTHLSVSEIIHKAFIEVNEVGTEAAATTAVVVSLRSMPAPQRTPKVFHANRPFFYAIYDNVHGFLFVGHFSSTKVEKSEKCKKCNYKNECKSLISPLQLHKFMKPSTPHPRSIWILTACWLLPLLCLALSLSPLVRSSDVTMADAAHQEFARRLALFSINVYEQLSTQKSGQNIVFSPFSIQTCAAMARLGAEGETATQLDRGLGLASSDAGQIAQSFHQVLAAYQDSQVLRIANKIFVMQGYPLRQEFDQLLTKQFLSGAQSVNFAKSAEAAATINGWVEQRTNHLIKDLVPASALDANSRLVLVNAIHFKGTWQHQFPKHATRPDTFHLDAARSVQVPMMSLKERFRYADLPALDATALELPYKDSDLSMLIVLPNSRTGLSALEEKLRATPLSQITQALHKTQVIVKLPKFKAEFQVELTDVFRQLGMSKMFSDQAEFGKMLQSPEPLKVSAIIHKAFIDVNEEGTEAAAATGMVMRNKRSITSLEEPVEFLADHPFTYALVHGEDLPLFWGSVVRLEESDFVSSEHDEL